MLPLGISCANSIEDEVVNYSIDFYPNPVADVVSILNTEFLSLQITNLQGQIVKQYTIPGDVGRFDVGRFEISLNYLEPGFYIFAFRNKDGRLVEIRKCVKI